MKSNTILILIIIILLLILGIGSIAAYKYYTTTQQEISNLESTKNFLAGKLETTENKLGQETATKEALKVTNEKYLLMMKDLEGAQKELQDVVRELKPQVAAILHTTTSLEASVPTEVTIDTLSNDSVVKPIYNSLYRDNWISLGIQAKYDSTSFDLKVEDKIQLTFDKKGFGKKQLYVTAFNQNPYTKTDELEGYTKKVPQRKFAVGPSISLGVTSKLEIEPVLGVSFSYILFSF